MSKTTNVEQLICNNLSLEEAEVVYGMLVRQFGLVSVVRDAKGVIVGAKNPAGVAPYTLLQAAGTRYLNNQGFRNVLLAANTAVETYRWLKQQGKVR